MVNGTVEANIVFFVPFFHQLGFEYVWGLEHEYVSVTVPGASIFVAHCHREPNRLPVSRVWNVRACKVSQTPPYSPQPNLGRPGRCCLLPERTGAAHKRDDFGAQ